MLIGSKRRSFISFAIISTAVLGALTALAPAGQAAGTTPDTAPVALAASAAPAVPAGTVRLGALASDTQLTVEVTLNIPDQSALTTFLNDVTTPGSADYGDFLAAGQFGPRFGPSLTEVAEVDAALRSKGLTPGPVASDRLSIPVTASAGAIERAFGITLDSYRMAGGGTAFANTAAPKIPADIAPFVQGVIGLDDLYPEQHMDTVEAPATREGPVIATPSSKGKAAKTGTTGKAASAVNPGPQACAAANGTGVTETTYADHYGMDELYQLGDYGQGERIGILELEPNLPSDITAFEQCYGISTKVNYIKVDGGAGTGAGVGEAALDIELVAAFAPKATIDVYQAPNNGGAPGDGFYDAFKKFVTSDVDKTLSVSWASCEPDTVTANVEAQENLFEQANAQGQSIFAAAGDSGSTGCYTGNANDPKLAVMNPASAPYVIGVGGTSFTSSTTNQQEIVWNDSGDVLASGAGGGGVSARWCMPSYQHRTKIPGIINKRSVKDTSKSCKTGYYREVPDVSAAADPLYGYTVYYDGSWLLGGVGGTSAATPLWASVAALIDRSPFCSAYGSKGPVLPQNLYAAASAYHGYIYASNRQVLYDVKLGNNDDTASGYTGGKYPADPGYDMASGLGVPYLSGLSGNEWITWLTGLSQLLCHASATKLKTVKVTSVKPDSGKRNTTKKVVVHGAGFMPVSAADRAQIIRGKKVLATVNASCSTTACTLTVPKESKGTVYIKIFALNLWNSGTPKAAEYKYT